MAKQTRVVPEVLAVLPVRDTVLFPGAVMPLPVGRESSLALLDSLEGPEKLLGVVAQLDPRVEVPVGTDLHGVGTLAKVHKMVRMPNGNVVAFLEGLSRIRVLEVTGLKPFLRARVEVQPDLEDQTDPELTALERNVQELFREVVARSPQLSDDLQTEAMNIDSPARLADFVSSTLPSLNTMVRQELLETFSVRKRLETLVNELSKEKEVLELRNKIHEQVQEQVNQSQREFLLREQMKAIQKELGESDDSQTEIEELRKKVEESGMSAEAKKECERELKRLAKMTPASAEYMVSRTYLEWMTSLPWNKTSGTGEDQMDIVKAQEILDEDHYDLKKVKERILDYLAVKKLNPGMKGPILCFVGPPGVGKTSLGKSIARAMGRKFVRISLGGMHDEAEIRGHRRTYIGALPGQIIQGIRRAETMDPVLLLDEVDKLGRDFRGDPSAALMEVLDPGAELDIPGSLSRRAVRSLSKVLFVATANWMDPIPEPLRDRMEIIELAGYTEEEKVHIANRFLIPRQAKEHGVTLGEQIEFTDESLHDLIHHYTREAGVRNLEREIATLVRKQARRLAEGKLDKLVVSPDVIREALGIPKFRLEKEVEERVSKPGVSVGLVWTPVGGDIVFIEASKMRGGKQFPKPGHLGEVMQESMRAALSLGPLELGPLRDRSGLLPEARPAHSRAVGSNPEGRSFGWNRNGHGAGELAHRTPGAAARRDDGRAFTHRYRASDRRDKGKRACSAQSAQASARVILPPENEPNEKEDLQPEMLEGIKLHFVRTVEQALEIALGKFDKPPVRPSYWRRTRALKNGRLSAPVRH